MFETDKESILYYFEKISRIPRESGDEKAVSDWILSWAMEKGLEALQDPVYNLIIKKPASAGYEKAEPVILQAHMDMVCEKNPDSCHDFKKDPILLKKEGDWLMSACGTSLGADNGIGMACGMAILADDSLKHPPLEVIFTVEEETTFRGADGLMSSSFESKRMINLDHAQEDELIAGSCGGTGALFTMPLAWEEEALQGYEAFELKVCGLKGGHSGEDIHRGRGNAIQLLMRVLQKAVSIGGKVVSVYGGTNRLAIPREATALVLIKDSDALKRLALEMKAVLKKEFGNSAPGLDVAAKRIEAAQMPESGLRPLKNGEIEKMAAVVRLIPDGVITMSGDFPGLVNSSSNLGILRALPESGALSITCEIRGLYGSMVEDTKDRMKELAAVFGAEIQFFAGYVSWEYRSDSELRKAALHLYEEMFGRKMAVSTVHAGLECGMFVEKEPEMDIISIGPSCQYFHSPMERVSVPSVRLFYGFLTVLLARLQ